MQSSMEELNSEDSGVQDVGPQIKGLVVEILEMISVLLVWMRRKAVEMVIIICVILLVFWVALFLYGSFYYSFMPTANFVAPVNFFYRTDCPSHHPMCSFPVANVSLLKNGKHQVMTYGQPYQITLELEMPESPTNQQLGMFLVTITPYSKAGQIIGVSSRSAMLHYRSSLIQTLGTLVFSPMFLSGMSEQKQSVTVELFSEFKDDSYKPTVGAMLEIHTPNIQIYKANLYIFAHFTGIRYLLYQFPLISALMGVMTNFAFLSLIIVLSFLQFNLNGRQFRRKAHMQQEEMDEIDDLLDDQSEPHDRGIIPENVDTMDCNSADMEESIPDVTGEDSGDSRELTNDEPICEAGNEETILRCRHLSQDSFRAPQVLTETTDKNYYRVGVCSSS
ncbi:BSCL2 lipid droplet biogenesis associated, seipin, like isoform X2 [Danio aesculapii]|uniref:BSCL2 lipid droplet biogenesis associated, seipin, like isoform X2 n=1 Tax=Danio aesculapii TaxID=1142201 RepID=UPI0024C0B62D|nr:BSCL2 lipid droplet biogenesis associated, seipin, like isoform X2 [Danio aesculapii]